MGSSWGSEGVNFKKDTNKLLQTKKTVTEKHIFNLYFCQFSHFLPLKQFLHWKSHSLNTHEHKNGFYRLVKKITGRYFLTTWFEK